MPIRPIERTLEAYLKNRERGCVVLDQPQQARNLRLPQALRLVFDTAALHY